MELLVRMVQYICENIRLPDEFNSIHPDAFAKAIHGFVGSLTTLEEKLGIELCVCDSPR